MNAEPELPSDVSPTKTLELRCSDGSIFTSASYIRRLPFLHQALAESDINPPTHPTGLPKFLRPGRHIERSIVTSLSVRDATDLINYVNSNVGLTDSIARLCVKHGIEISQDALKLLSLDHGALVERKFNLGPLLALCSSHGARGFSNLAETSETIGTERFELSLESEATASVRWIVSKCHGDGFSWPCLKIVLPALPTGCLWKSDVVDRILRRQRWSSTELDADDKILNTATTFEVSGRANRMVTSAVGRWPTRTNEYADHWCERQHMRSVKPWLIAIPIANNDIMGSKKRRFYPKSAAIRTDVHFEADFNIGIADLVDVPDGMST